MESLIRPIPRTVQRFTGSQLRYYSAPVDGSIPAAKKRFVPDQGTYPKGFLVGSAHAGVKASNKTRDDVALIASERLCKAVGFFTKNKFAAAPVRLTKEIISQHKTGDQGGIRGVVINSGCANAVTGKEGYQDAKEMSEAVDELFSSETKAESNSSGNSSRTLVMSTGVIGQRLPIQKILTAIPLIKPKLGDAHDQWLAVSKAVMTTDTFPKLVSRQFTFPSNPSVTYSIAGFSKGAGMIHPNMATMLSVICTDVNITRDCLETTGRSALQKSFNSISIDGDTSTNDSLVLFANGAAADGAKALDRSDTEDVKVFTEALREVATDLAKLVVRDGEGATKFVSIHVRARDATEAQIVGRAIAVSPLVKTALYGKDANWGRILCAIGNVDHDSVVPEKVSVSFGLPGTNGEKRLELVVKGDPILPVDEAVAKTILEEEDIDIFVDLNSGEDGCETNTTYTCDLTHEYITINGDYRT